MLKQLFCNHVYRAIRVKHDSWVKIISGDIFWKPYTIITHRCEKCYKLKYEEFDGILTDREIERISGIMTK